MTKILRQERRFNSVVKSLSKGSTVNMRSFGLATKTPTKEEIADIRTVIYVRDLLGFRIENLNLVNSLMPKPASRSIEASVGLNCRVARIQSMRSAPGVPLKP